MERTRISVSKGMCALGRARLGEDGEQGKNLYDRVELAEEAGTEISKCIRSEEQGGDEQDAEVPAEDQDSHVARNEADVGEDQEERAEQELVGDGVEIEAESGLLAEPAGEQAVEAV